MRAGSLIKVLLVSLVFAALATAVAIFIPWLPEQSSKEAERIDFVFWFVTAICIAIFAVVAAISVYSLFKFRARPDDDSDGPPIHGHTGIEIAWTAIPLVLVVAMIAVSSVALVRNDRVPDNALRVEVWGHAPRWTSSSATRGRGSSCSRTSTTRSCTRAKWCGDCAAACDNHCDRAKGHRTLCYDIPANNNQRIADPKSSNDRLSANDHECDRAKARRGYSTSGATCRQCHRWAKDSWKWRGSP